LFTFGREHERKCAIAYVRDPAQAALIVTVVDAVHDLLESTSGTDALRQALRDALCKGGSGVWEGAATWLRKCSVEYPDLARLWTELAQHSTAEVRFRVACCLDDIPEVDRGPIGQMLLTDKSKRVVQMARARLGLEDPVDTDDTPAV
jgi:hypothetical protein